MKKINEVSQIVGVSKRTLQYYDDEGILPIERAVNNHRVYDKDALERIWQILIYKEMGFELKDIKQLLQLSDNQKDTCLKERIDTIRNQIITLQVQMTFISLVRINGMPSKPEEYRGKTYVKYVEEISKKIKREITEEETYENE